MDDLAQLKKYILMQGNAYNPFLGHHYYFKISKPDEEYQREAAFLHPYIGTYGYMRFREILNI
jgi:hypothetical protein